MQRFTPRLLRVCSVCNRPQLSLRSSRQYAQRQFARSFANAVRMRKSEREDDNLAEMFEQQSADDDGDDAPLSLRLINPVNETLYKLTETDLDGAIRYLDAHAAEMSIDDYHKVLSALGLSKRSTDMIKLIQTMKKRTIEPNQTTYTLLLRYGRTHNATPPITVSVIIDELKSRNSPLSTYLLDEYTKELINQRNFTAAVSQMSEINRRGLQPTAVSYDLQIRAMLSSHSSPYRPLKYLINDMIRQQVRPRFSTLIKLIPLMTQDNDTQLMLRLFRAIQSSSGVINIHSTFGFNILLQYLMKHKLYDDVYAVYRFMQLKSVIKDVRTYGVLMTVCSYRGDIYGIMSLFQEMIKNKIEPNVIIFVIMIDANAAVFNYSGMLRAYELMEQHSVRPNEHVFNALFKGINQWHARQLRFENGTAHPDDIVKTTTSTTTTTTTSSTSNNDSNEKVSPLSTYFLPWMDTIALLDVRPSFTILRMLLYALRTDGDISNLLYYMHMSSEYGYIADLAIFEYAMITLAKQPYHAYTRLQFNNLLLQFHRAPELQMTSNMFASSLLIGLNSRECSEVMTVYDRMKSTGTFPTHQTYSRMITLCLTSDLPVESDRMNMIITLCTDARIHFTLNTDDYNAWLYAHATRGDTREMTVLIKEMQQANMPTDSLSTRRAIERAREHVYYSLSKVNRAETDKDMQELEKNIQQTKNQSDQPTTRSDETASLLSSSSTEPTAVDGEFLHQLRRNSRMYGYRQTAQHHRLNDDVADDNVADTLLPAQHQSSATAGDVELDLIAMEWPHDAPQHNTTQRIQDLNVGNVNNTSIEAHTNVLDASPAAATPSRSAAIVQPTVTTITTSTAENSTESVSLVISDDACPFSVYENFNFEQKPREQTYSVTQARSLQLHSSLQLPSPMSSVRGFAVKKKSVSQPKLQPSLLSTNRIRKSFRLSPFKSNRIKHRQ